MKSFLIVLLVGILGGLVLTVAPGIILISILIIGALIFINFIIRDESSKIFLRRIFLLGLIIRIVFANLNYYIPASATDFPRSDSQPDASTFNGNALYIARITTQGEYTREMLNNELQAVYADIKACFEQYKGEIPEIGTYQFDSYVGLIGALYSWLGYSPITAKILNSIISCLAAILTYFIARKLFKEEITAKISAALVMFFPSIIFWSVSLLRDPIINFLFLLYILFVFMFLNKKKFYYLLAALVTIYISSIFRIQLLPVYLTGLSFILFLIFCKKIFAMKSLSRTIVLTLLCLIGTIVIIAKYQFIFFYIKKAINAVFFINKAYAIYYPHATWYKIYPESFYSKTVLQLRDFLNPALAISLFKALTYYFLSPFPWNPQRLALLPFAIQAIFTFICAPFAIKGVLVSWRQNKFPVFSLILLLVFLITICAMTEGIVGIVVRHRDMFMPVIFIFASIGFYLTFVGKSDVQVAENKLQIDNWSNQKEAKQ